MSTDNFTTPQNDRYFEDYIPGTVHAFGPIKAEEGEMLDFARRYDPQSFHTDPEAAQGSMYGGIIASGWFTCALMMRLYAAHYVSTVAGLGSPGIDELRWILPVRPNDALSVRATIREARRSRTKPDRGIVNTFIEVLNQKGEVVMTMRVVNLFLCRD
ncbi:MAG: MaoC family dehydratase [Anaerolineae bacterium]